MQRKFIEYKNLLRQLMDEDNREAGFSVESAIIIAALVAMALVLVGLLWNVFDNHTSGLQ